MKQKKGYLKIIAVAMAILLCAGSLTALLPGLYAWAESDDATTYTVRFFADADDAQPIDEQWIDDGGEVFAPADAPEPPEGADELVGWYEQPQGLNPDPDEAVI